MLQGQGGAGAPQCALLRLSLRANKLLDAGLKALVEALVAGGRAGACRLEALDVASNSLSVACVEDVCALLGALPSLQARKVIQLAEANPTDAFEYRYDERNPFVVCNGSMLPIYRGSALVRSTYSKAAYSPEFKGKLCAIDGMSEIGGEAPGLEESFFLDA